MNEAALSAFERRLLDEVAKVETRIKELNIEKQALQRQIARARSERTGIQDVTRKNSINRVLAENSIVEFIRQKGKECTTKQLYDNARVTNFDLKEATFRTYLHRMKKRGMIETGRFVGHWRLSAKLSPPLS
jgi:hypothetical protein